MPTIETQLIAEKKKLALMQEVGRALSSSIDLDSLLTLIVENISLLMEAERSTLYLLSEDGQSLWSRLAQGNEQVEIRLKIGEGLAGWVASSGETINIQDAYNDNRFQPAYDQKTGYRTRSILCIPMRNHFGNIIGVVQVLNKQAGPFDEDDEALLAALASLAAIAIENTKLYQSVVSKNEELYQTQEELKQRSFEINVLYDIEREMNSLHDLDELLERILLRSIEIVGATAGSIALISKRLGDLRFHTTSGKHGDRVLKHRLQLGKGIIGWVAAHGKPAIVNNPDEDPRHATDFAEKIGLNPSHILCAPLIYGDEVLGAIEIIDKLGPSTRSDASVFDEDDLRLLQLIAGQVSRAVQLARANVERENENRLAAIGQMMAGVLHDLKTPMTIVSWYADMMAEIENEGERKSYIELIKRQFDLMNGMTREVLAFARGDSDLFIRKVYLSRFLEEVIEQLKHELQGKNIDMRLEAGYSGIAYFDENKILRVIHNLVRNAMQAMPTGGEILIRTKQATGGLIFEFEDNGPGIPQEMKGRLFEPFTTIGKKSGSGLGLAIVKKIIDDHAGEIKVLSNTGKGTCFQVKLPLREEAVVERAQHT